MEEQPKVLTAAEKHYLAMKEAQKRYYEKKAGPKEDRRPRGRPKKVVEGGASDSRMDE